MIYWHHFFWTKSYQLAVETLALRTSQDISHTHIYIYWKRSIDKTIFIWTQSYPSAVQTPTLRTSQDITTYTHIYIYLKWSTDRNIFIWTHSYQSAVETPTLRTSQDITTCKYIRSSTHIEYGIEILAAPDIPGIELEKRYLEYLRIQLTSKKVYLEYR